MSMLYLLMLVAPASLALAGLTNGISLLLPWAVTFWILQKLHYDVDADLDL